MRRACLILGLALLAAIWGGPLLSVWRESFAAHMFAHMGVVAIAAPLIAIGLGGYGSALFSPFAGRRCRQAELPLIRPFGAPSPRERGEGRAAPVIASLVELIVVWAWHAPAMRALAESSTMAAVVEQVSFLAVGLFLWLSCLGWRQSSASPGAGAFGLLLTSVHMTLLGALLALSPRPLYGLAEVTCFGVTLSASQDQALGGVTMLMIGAAVYLAGGVWLLAQLLGETKDAEPAR